MSDIVRALIDALLPSGSIWEPEDSKDLDKLLDGISDCGEDARVILAKLSDIRRPSKTDSLDDLEKEFGIVKNTNSTEQQRRDQIAAIKFLKGGKGDKDFLQTAFNTAGFDVQIHINDPAVDPGGLLDSEEYTTAGNINKLAVDLISEDWPLVLFVAGDATLGGGGEITDLEYGFIAIDSAPVFDRILQSILPMHAWAGVKVIGFKNNYFGFDEDPSANTFGDIGDPDVGGYLSEIL